MPGFPPLQPSATDEAIRGIGTNGIPFLLKWIGYNRPAWRERLYTKINAVVLHVNRSWWFHDRRDIREGRRARRSINALLALGPASENAVGDLTRMIEKPRGKASAARAAIVLNGLGKPTTIGPFTLNVGSQRLEVHGPIIDSHKLWLWEATMNELGSMQAERAQAK